MIKRMLVFSTAFALVFAMSSGVASALTLPLLTPPVGFERPPVGPVDPWAPAVSLRTASSTITAIMSENPTRLPAVGAAVNAAYMEIAGGETDFSRFYDRLIDGAVAASTVRMRTDSGVSALQYVEDVLANAGHLYAENAIGVARRAGASDTDYSRARNSLASGEALQLNRDIIGALRAYKDAHVITFKLVFDLATFEQNIRTRFFPKAPGFAYSIHDRSSGATRSGAQGAARTNADSPVAAMTADKEMMVVSVTKTLTAIAALSVLGNGVSGRISGWLPSSWTLGPGVNTITFEQLMTHRSGLRRRTSTDCCSATYSSQRQIIAKGQAPSPNDFSYLNANFSLFRVMLPRIGGLVPVVYDPIFGLPLFGGLDDDLLSRLDFSLMMQQRVFAPAGVLASCVRTDPNPTLAYPQNSTGQSGTDVGGDWSDECGGWGMFISPVELTQVLTSLRSGAIISPDLVRLMNSRFLGWDDPANQGGNYANGLLGVYHGKGGDWFQNGTPSVPSLSSRRGLASCVMAFPNGIDASVVANSASADWTSHQCTELRDAFDGAWVWRAA